LGRAFVVILSVCLQVASINGLTATECAAVVPAIVKIPISSELEASITEKLARKWFVEWLRSSQGRQEEIHFADYEAIKERLRQEAADLLRLRLQTESFPERPFHEDVSKFVMMLDQDRAQAKRGEPSPPPELSGLEHRFKASTLTMTQMLYLDLYVRSHEQNESRKPFHRGLNTLDQALISIESEDQVYGLLQAAKDLCLLSPIEEFIPHPNEIAPHFELAQKFLNSLDLESKEIFMSWILVLDSPGRFEMLQESERLRLILDEWHNVLSENGFILIETPPEHFEFRSGPLPRHVVESWASDSFRSEAVEIFLKEFQNVSWVSVHEGLALMKAYEISNLHNIFQHQWNLMSPLDQHRHLELLKQLEIRFKAYLRERQEKIDESKRALLAFSPSILRMEQINHLHLFSVSEGLGITHTNKDTVYKAQKNIAEAEKWTSREKAIENAIWLSPFQMQTVRKGYRQRSRVIRRGTSEYLDSLGVEEAKIFIAWLEEKDSQKRQAFRALHEALLTRLEGQWIERLKTLRRLKLLRAIPNKEGAQDQFRSGLISPSIVDRFVESLPLPSGMSTEDAAELFYNKFQVQWWISLEEGAAIVRKHSSGEIRAIFESQWPHWSPEDQKVHEDNLKAVTNRFLFFLNQAGG